MEFFIIAGIAVVFFILTVIADRMMTDSEEQPPVEPPSKPMPVAKPKRARTKKGHYKADDPSTPDVNEAWVGGKAPKTKPKKKKTTRKKKTTTKQTK